MKDRYKFIGDNKISMNELRKEVNKLDKKFGARLKEPEIWSDPERYIETYQAEAERNLKAIICTINGIDPSEFIKIDEDSVSIKDEIISDKNVTDLSFVDWNSDLKMDVNSIAFRCKYVSLVLSEFIDNINKVVHRYVDINTMVHHSMAEKEILMTKEFINDCVKFAYIMMYPGLSYKNIIVKMIMWTTYLKKNIDHHEYNLYLVDHIKCSREFTHKDPISKIAVFDDDQSIYAILETSYMLVTNYIKDETRNIPKFKKVNGATREYDLIRLIEALGAAILESREPQKLSIHFKSFILSHPKILTEYYEETKENAAIKYGVYALGYLKFIYDDKIMSELIDEMLKKGK